MGTGWAMGIGWTIFGVPGAGVGWGATPAGGKHVTGAGQQDVGHDWYSTTHFGTHSSWW
jgi:hypothetical protein